MSHNVIILQSFFSCRFFWAQQCTGYQEKTTETLSTPSTAPTTWQGERERENFDHLVKNLALALPVVLSNLKSVNPLGPWISLLWNMNKMSLCAPHPTEISNHRGKVLFSRNELLAIREPFVGKKTESMSHSVFKANKTQLGWHWNVWNEIISYQKIECFL